MSKNKPQLIAALDVNTLAEARELLDKLKDAVQIFKVGSQLFTSCGPAVVRFIEAQGKKVFLDLKYHDIPNTVGRAVEAAVGLSVALERSMDFANRQTPKSRGLFMFTVHTVGGMEMLKAAVRAAQDKAKSCGLQKPLIVGVTVLTSEEKRDNILASVLKRAEMAKAAGLDGVVASCEEAAFLRKQFGPDFVIVTPGIRPRGSEAQDQKRVATPREAVQNGSDYLVVGRPIVQTEDPARAARAILTEIAAA